MFISLHSHTDIHTNTYTITTHAQQKHTYKKDHTKKERVRKTERER